MFAVPGLLALILVEYLRPQEYFPVLASLPLLHLSAGLALVGFAVDLRLGLSQLRAAPHLALVGLFAVWCLVTLAVRAPDQYQRAQALVIPLVVYLLLAHGIQSFRMLQVVCGLLLAVSIALSALGVHQGLAPMGCYRIGVSGGHTTYFPDGRPCSEEDPGVCETGDPEPGADYVCEKQGLLGTQSDHGRVRYRGTLEDPNELSLAIGIAMPFAFAFFDRRRSVLGLLLVVATCGLVGLCTYFTQSRGGQLVYLAVLAVYFVSRYGWRRGLAVGVVLALPILVLGGRSGGESSTMERLECWWVGLHMVVASPGFGAGYGQFLEHHYLTAHNSFILATAELGLIGMLLFTSVVYVAVKIPLQALRAEVAPVARTWALALLASMAGLIAGSLFLSYAYKDIFWLYIGLSGVLYHAVQRHDPDFRVRFRARDLGLVALIDLGLLLFLMLYTATKLGW